MRGQDAAVLGRALPELRLEHDRAGAVPEQDAGGAVRPVEDAREGLGADDESALVRAGGEELVGGRNAVDEAGAHRLQIEGGAVVDAEPGLYLRRRRGKGVVGR